VLHPGMYGENSEDEKATDFFQVEVQKLRREETSQKFLCLALLYFLSKLRSTNLPEVENRMRRSAWARVFARIVQRLVHRIIRQALLAYGHCRAVQVGEYHH
jgi:hypothetical protein